jgi:hypothetical protein
VYKDAKPKQTGPEILNAIAFLIFVSKFKVKNNNTWNNKQKNNKAAPFEKTAVIHPYKIKQ